LHYLATSAGNPHVICLQELKIADVSALTFALQAGQGAGMPYTGSVFASIDTAASRGIAILVRKTSAIRNLPESPSALERERLQSGDWVSN
jgi:exonuclease III